MSMDAPTVDVLRKQAIAMAMLWLTARDYDHEGGRAWFHVRARDLGLRDGVLPGKRIRVTIESDLDTDGVLASEPVGRCKHCGITPGSVVQVGWICKDDLKRLRETGEAEVYEERQEFRLLPEQEQFPVYVRKDAADVDLPDGAQQ